MFGLVHFGAIPHDWPSCAVLSTLGLSGDELASLARQGFVSRESRNGQDLYKLRFRHHGRQRVRSLGSDPQRADHMRTALADWQAPRQCELSSRRRLREARRLRQGIKQRLLASVTAAGFRFHGRAIRGLRCGRPRLSESEVFSF